MKDTEAEFVFPMIFTCKYCKRSTIFSDEVCAECTSDEALE